jgi:hypothetical protein
MDTSKLSPLQRANITTIVEHLGIDSVIESQPNELIGKFSVFRKELETKGGFYPRSPVNGGAITGFRGNGFVDNDHNLTELGVSVFKAIANEMKN